MPPAEALIARKVPGEESPEASVLDTVGKKVAR